MKFIGKTFPLFCALIVGTNFAWGASNPFKLWEPEGVPVTIASGHQLRAVACSDGVGGAIIVWEDSRDENRRRDIYGQHISKDGVILWTVNGVPLVTANQSVNQPAGHNEPAIVGDGFGGAIVTWTDDRYFQGDVFAQSVDLNGVERWQMNGVPICTACYPSGLCANYKQNPQIASDGSGGAIITWYEIRDGLHFSVWAQRVKTDGATDWAVNGVPVAYGSFYADFPKISSDGSGTAIIAWQDGRNGNCQVFAQQFNSNGTAQWTPNGIEVSPAIASRGVPGHSIISDGSGGAIIVWVDGRLGDPNDSNIYAQRINSNGQIQWQPDGVPVCTRQRHQYAPTITTDGAGGAIITWEDQGASPEGSGQQWIYTQRVSALGELRWTIDGVLISTRHSFGPQIVTDGRGGGIVVWDSVQIIDPFTHKPSIFAQRFTADGQTLWPTNGFEAYSIEGGHYGLNPKAISDGDGGVSIFWTDYRYYVNSDIPYWDIFAQRLSDKLTGDIDGNNVLNLTDAILALQTLSGMTPSNVRQNYVISEADANDDTKIGLEEVIYILQKVAGVR